MDEVPWIYRRDEFDLLLGRAAALQRYADIVETILLPEAYSRDGKTGYITPAEFTRLSREQTVNALDEMSLEAYREGNLDQPELIQLLARIGVPHLIHSVDSSGKHDVEYWPQFERQPSRTDLLYSYLFAKVLYLELKARLQVRSVSDEELGLLSDATRTLLSVDLTPTNSAEQLKLELIKAWQRCPLERPGGAVGSRLRAILRSLFRR